MKKRYFSKSENLTRQIGKKLAREIKDGRAICLFGDLGSGKTTFCQGVLEGLGAEGPYTSPTFLIMKEYLVGKKKFSKGKIKRVCHFDAYRVGAKDLLFLGWEELLSDPETLIILEWPERVEEIVPEDAQRIRFLWRGEKEREIIFEKFGKKTSN